MRMARQTTVTVTDDLDGSANAKEVSFGLDGTSWTIDLSAKNRAALEKALKPYIAKAPGSQPGGREAELGDRAGCPPNGLRAGPYEYGGGPRLGQEQRIPGQRPGPDQRRSPTGVRLHALSPQARTDPAVPHDMAIPEESDA